MALPALGVRRQLSLFANPEDAAAIERLRQHVDPVQFALIPAHVTLCREEDLSDLDEAQLHQRIQGARMLTLGFGAPEPFSTHGLLLPCIEGEDAFQALRTRVLGGRSERHQSPHITLAHPRNPKAAGNSLQSASALGAGLRCRFDRLNLIEQIAGQAWQILRQWSLPA